MEILENKVPVSIGFLMVLIGIFIYHVMLIRSSSNVDKFSDIKISIWWAKEQIRFILSFIIIMVFFYMSWYYDKLTGEHCLYLGVIGNFALDRFMKIMEIGTIKQP